MSARLGRALVISGNPGRWSAAQPDAPYRNWNGVEAWVYALEGDYAGGNTAPKSIEGYSLVIGNLNPWLVPQLLKLAESRPRGCRWVSLIEGDGSLYLDPEPELLRLLRASDVVATINRHTTAYLDWLSGGKAAFVGIPYPVDEVSALSTPWDKREDAVLVACRTGRGPSLAVAGAVGLPADVFVPKVARKLGNAKKFIEHGAVDKEMLARRIEREYPSVRLRAQIELDQPDFLRFAGTRKLWINLDPRFTWARNVLDAAALGVPVVSTSSTSHGSELFPELTVDSEYDLEAATELAIRALADEPWAQSVVSQARQQLETFRPEACVDRLEQALAARK